MRALLRAPELPAYPGGRDMQRDAFYAGLGGSGFALGAAELIAAGNPSGPMRFVQRLRERVGARFTAGIPGAAGTIAATLFTGLSGGIPVADHDAFRNPAWRICWRWPGCISALHGLGDVPHPRRPGAVRVHRVALADEADRRVCRAGRRWLLHDADGNAPRSCAASPWRRCILSPCCWDGGAAAISFAFHCLRAIQESGWRHDQAVGHAFIIPVFALGLFYSFR